MPSVPATRIGLVRHVGLGLYWLGTYFVVTPVYTILLQVQISQAVASHDTQNLVTGIATGERMHALPSLHASFAVIYLVLFGVLLAGEQFGMHEIGAMAVILAGVVIITLAKARKSIPAVSVPTEPAA